MLNEKQDTIDKTYHIIMYKNTLCKRNKLHKYTCMKIEWNFPNNYV